MFEKRDEIDHFRALKLIEAVLALKHEKDEGKIVEAIKTHSELLILHLFFFCCCYFQTC